MITGGNVDTYFVRCVNGHYYEANKYDVCPYCSAEADYTQYLVNSDDDQAVTMRSSVVFGESGRSSQGYGSVSPQDEKTVRYADYQSSSDSGRQSQPKVTKRMEEDGFDNGKIDPVNIALSAPLDVENPKYMMNRGKTSDGSRPKGTCFLEPVGWLICVDGPDFGKSYPLREGKNSIGRSDEMDVVLKNDPYISRKNHAWIEYVEEERKFIISVGEAKKMIYLNDELVLMPLEMGRNDILILEDTSLALIPCCDENFSWKSARKKGSFPAE